jgi:16S rRNA (guanine527-N7)-methyltransferase
MDTDARSIDAAARGMGLSLDEWQAQALSLHLRSVLETNKLMNLTSIDEEGAVALHILDSLTALSALGSAPAGAFADLGSGPGYPGIPLAVVSGRGVALVESVKKKAAFLQRVVDDLRLEATVHPVRAEELAVEMPGCFSAVVARALSALPSIVELASPLLEPGGVLVCMKGALNEDEVSHGDRAGALCGLHRESVSRVVIPGLEVERTIVTYRKSSPAKVRLPRRPGLAQHQPLA